MLVHHPPAILVRQTRKQGAKQPTTFQQSHSYSWYGKVEQREQHRCNRSRARSPYQHLGAISRNLHHTVYCICYHLPWGSTSSVHDTSNSHGRGRASNNTQTKRPREMIRILHTFLLRRLRRPQHLKEQTATVARHSTIAHPHRLKAGRFTTALIYPETQSKKRVGDPGQTCSTTHTSSLPRNSISG